MWFRKWWLHSAKLIRRQPWKITDLCQVVTYPGSLRIHVRYIIRHIYLGWSNWTKTKGNRREPKGTQGNHIFKDHSGKVMRKLRPASTGKSLIQGPMWRVISKAIWTAPARHFRLVSHQKNRCRDHWGSTKAAWNNSAACRDPPVAAPG